MLLSLKACSRVELIGFVMWNWGVYDVELRDFLGGKGVDLLCGIDVLNWNSKKSQKVAIYWIIKINYLIFISRQRRG